MRTGMEMDRWKDMQNCLSELQTQTTTDMMGGDAEGHGDGRMEGHAKLPIASTKVFAKVRLQKMATIGGDGELEIDAHTWRVGHGDGGGGGAMACGIYLWTGT